MAKRARSLTDSFGRYAHIGRKAEFRVEQSFKRPSSRVDEGLQ